MPDPLEPKDLSHLSDQEFMALCPIGEHAPGPEPLSPASQAVLDATFDHWPGGHNHPHKRVCIAAALRAAADKVVSSVPPPCADFDEHAKGFLAAHVKYRRDLLAIAAELEGQQSAVLHTNPMAISHDCNNCLFSKWKRTSSGSLHPSGEGRCTWDGFKDWQLPASMYFVQSGDSRKVPIPCGGAINRKKPHTDCAHYLPLV